MQNISETTERMSAKDIFAAVHNLKKKLEENFVELGQLFSLIKRKKLFLAKGYDNFRDFVENEYNINSALAGKLCSVYEVYTEELDMDDVTMKQLGFDRLNLIKPYAAKGYPEADRWIEMAEQMPVGELKKQIKEIKQKEKEKGKSMKEVLVDQFIERMTTELNCSRRELNFKLALYFQDADMESVRKVIKQKQRRYEQEDASLKEA